MLMPMTSRFAKVDAELRDNDDPFPMTFEGLAQDAFAMAATVNRRLKKLRRVQLVEHGSEGYYLIRLGETLFEVLEPFELRLQRWAKQLEEAEASSWRW